LAEVSEVILAEVSEVILAEVSEVLGAKDIFQLLQIRNKSDLCGGRRRLHHLKGIVIG
jgi:hypothetical protein